MPVRKGQTLPKRGKRLTKPCAFCGASLTRLICMYPSVNWFCNKDCHARYQDGRSLGRRAWNLGLTKADRPTLARTGRIVPEETKAKMRSAHMARVALGLNHLYIDGRSYRSDYRRGFTSDYKIWRNAVLRRDGKACKRCQETSSLEAHHIKPWANFPELRYDVSNGVTLCTRCHAMVDPTRMARLPATEKEAILAATCGNPVSSQIHGN